MEIDIRGRMALVRHRLGESKVALEELQTCLSYWQAKDSTRWIALVELDIASVLRDTENHAEADQYLTSSHKRFEQVGDRYHADRAQRMRSGSMRTAAHTGRP
jgi:hypothetical protein